jgi:hypothetical protein
MEHTLDYLDKPPNYKNHIKRAVRKFPNTTPISEKQFESITKKDCNYCGKNGPNGIDRIDNSIGYIKVNCVACCKHCNYAKGNLSIADFNTWTKRFVKNQNEKSNGSNPKLVEKAYLRKKIDEPQRGQKKRGNSQEVKGKRKEAKGKRKELD